MQITESEIRKLIRKHLLESAPGSITGVNKNTVKITGNFIADFKKFDIYLKNKDLQDFVNIIETKGITSFFNDILIYLNNNNEDIVDSDGVSKDIIDNIKTLDGTTKPWQANNPDDLVKKLNDIEAQYKTDQNSIVNKLYNLTAPSKGAGAWGAGKGEILSLFLTNSKYKTGGSGKKDLYASDADFIELKQIDTKATKININISSLKPGEQIAKDFAENLKDLKNSINVFKNILQEDFIDSNELKNKKWINLFFDGKNKPKDIKNKSDSPNSFLEEFDDSNNKINIQNDFTTNIYDIIARFIFNDYNDTNKDEYAKYIVYSFYDPKTFKMHPDVLKNLQIPKNIESGKIFPLFDNSNRITSYTNDIKDCYNNKSINFPGSPPKKPATPNQQTPYTKLKEKIENFKKGSFDINAEWYSEIFKAFNIYFNGKLDVINNYDKLNLDLNRFSLGDFDTLMNDILLGSVTKIKDKIKVKNSDLASDIKTDDISITLDDGKNEIELYTKIDDIEILEPNPIPNLDNIENIPNDVRKININSLSFNDEQLKKKLKDKKYKRFFALAESRIFESNVTTQNINDILNDMLNQENYISISTYKKTKDLKNATFLQKINNLIANLICLEKSISKYFSPGLIVVSEEKVKDDNSKFTEALVMCSSIINKIDDDIKAGYGRISFFDLNKMKIETRDDTENLLFKLIKTREGILNGIKEINAITIP